MKMSGIYLRIRQVIQEYFKNHWTSPRKAVEFIKAFASRLYRKRAQGKDVKPDGWVENQINQTDDGAFTEWTVPQEILDGIMASRYRV